MKAAIAVVATVAAAIGAAMVWPAHPPAEQVNERLGLSVPPPSSSQRVCAGFVDPAVTSQMTVAAPDADPAGNGGRIEVTGWTSGRSRSLATINDAGRAVSVRPDTRGFVSAQARGRLTGNLAGVVVASSTTGAARGVASVVCQPPQTSWWFTGLSGTTGARQLMTLLNPGDNARTVTVSGFTSDGPRPPKGLSEMIVPPHGRYDLYLSAAFPGMNRLGVRVESAGGPITAQIRSYAARADLVPAGIDWIPATAPPARTFTTSAFATGQLQHTLWLTNPGDIATTASVVVNGVRTHVAPVGLQNVTVPAGSTTQVSFTHKDPGPVALTVTADRPVTAAVRTSRAAEFSVSAAGSLLRATKGTPVYAGSAVPPKADGLRLALTAPDDPATVRLLYRDGNGRVLVDRTLEVAAQMTSSVTLPRRTSAGSVEIEVRSGAVSASMVWHDNADKSSPDALTGWPLNRLGRSAGRSAVLVNDPGILGR